LTSFPRDDHCVPVGYTNLGEPSMGPGTKSEMSQR
jgi:hypothetical protein